MPDLKVSEKVRFENFIRMTWDDFEELYAVVAPMIVKKIERERERERERELATDRNFNFPDSTEFSSSRCDRHKKV